MMADIKLYVDGLSDAELYDALVERGFAVGPVVSSTRKLYRVKLAKALKESQSNDWLQDENEQLKFDSEETNRGFRKNFRDWETEEQEETQSLSQRRSVKACDSESAERKGMLSHSQAFGALPKTYSQGAERDRFSGMKTRFSEPGCSWMGQNTSGTVLVKDIGVPRGPTTGESTYYSGRRSFQLGSERTGYSVRERNTFTGPDIHEDLADRHQVMSPMHENVPQAGHRPQNTGPKNSFLEKLADELTAIRILLVCIAIAAIFAFILFMSEETRDPYQQIEDDAKKAMEERRQLNSPH